jgi:hypothetical protein
MKKLRNAYLYYACCKNIFLIIQGNIMQYLVLYNATTVALTLEQTFTQVALLEIILIYSYV